MIKTNKGFSQKIPGIILLIIFVVVPFWGEEITVFEGLTNPKKIAVNDHQLYVIDQYSLFIYSLKTSKLLTKIGNKGQGPAEFSTPPSLQVLENGILLYTNFKYVLLSPHGTFIEEKKLAFPFLKINKVGQNFVVKHWTFGKNKQRFTEFNLYNRQFKKNHLAFQKRIKNQIAYTNNQRHSPRRGIVNI